MSNNRLHLVAYPKGLVEGPDGLYCPTCGGNDGHFDSCGWVEGVLYPLDEDDPQDESYDDDLWDSNSDDGPLD